jgi:Ca-activated chloride channel family protein
MSIPFLPNIILGRPEWLLLLLLLPLMGWWRGRTGKAPTIAFSTAFVLREMGVRTRSARGGFTFGLVLVSLSAAIIALARPQKITSRRTRRALPSA